MELRALGFGDIFDGGDAIYPPLYPVRVYRHGLGLAARNPDNTNSIAPDSRSSTYLNILNNPGHALRRIFLICTNFRPPSS